MRNPRRSRPPMPVSSAFGGFRFPPGGDPAVCPLVPARRLSYRDLEELLAERGIEVDRVNLSLWVQKFTPLLVDAARPC